MVCPTTHIGPGLCATSAARKLKSTSRRSIMEDAANLVSGEQNSSVTGVSAHPRISIASFRRLNDVNFLSLIRIRDLNDG